MPYALTWREAWRYRRFRLFTALLVLLMAITFSFYPAFFEYVEQRPGISIYDPVLSLVQPVDVSMLVMLLIWTSSALMIWRAVINPVAFIKLAAAYNVLILLRIVTILAVPLQTPPGLIELVDPFSNLFYGHHFITRDLFFSGHSASLFIFYFCADKKFVRYWCLISSVLVACFVLLQHVHYTIDAVFAFPGGYLCYRAGLPVYRAAFQNASPS
jgi:hypothetical protein